MSIQQNQIVQPTYNGQDIYYRTPVDAIITDGMSLDDYIRNTTGVVESGSNSNGSYIKFADGTLIQEGNTGSFTIPANTGGNKDVTFPINFYDTNYYVTQTSLGGVYYSWVAVATTNKTVSGFTCNCWNNTTASACTTEYSWIAIGRWKDYDASVLPDQQQSTIINSASTNYYDDERVVGIWIDGKPIYRRVIKVTSIDRANNNYDVAISISNLNEIVNIGGTIKIATDNTYKPVTVIYTNNSNSLDSDYSFSVYAITNSYITLSYGSWLKKVFDKAYIILEYTKTTDSPITSQTKDLLTVVNGKDISNLETIIQQRVDQVIADRLSLNDAYWVGWSRSNASLSAGSSLWNNMTTSKSKNVTYSSNVLTVNKSGLYFFKAFTHWQGTSTGSRHFFEATISGGSPSTKTNIRSEDDEYQTGDPVVTCTELLYLQAGAKITMIVYTSAAATFMGAATNSVDASSVYLYKIGDYIDI